MRAGLDHAAKQRLDFSKRWPLIFFSIDEVCPHSLGTGSTSRELLLAASWLRLGVADVAFHPLEETLSRWFGKSLLLLV